jgi:hypothetical protein
LSYAITGTSYSAPIGTNTLIGQTAATAHKAGNVGSVGLFINDGGNPSGVFVTNTFDGTFSSQEVEIKTDQGGVSAATIRLKATKTGDIQISTGNIVPSTAAKGINFTANTPAAGMTSQLLNWYEEGTWTPTIGGTATYTARTGRYTRVGKLVTFLCDITINVRGTGSRTTIEGLPFSSTANYPVQFGYFENLMTAVVFPAGFTGGTGISLYGLAAAGVSSAGLDFMQNGTRIMLSGTYHIV